MSSSTPLPAGDFRSTYAADTTIFPTRTSRNVALLSLVILAFAPLFLPPYWLSILIQIGYYAVAALGLNILVGFTGQISIGHAAFFGFGAFASAWLNNRFAIPVIFSIPLAGLLTTGVGMIFGVPAARLKGLYLAIATLAAQYILQDFFARAEWFTGGVAGTPAEPFSIFGYAFDTDQSYFYIVLFCLIAAYLSTANMMRTRDGRAYIAVRDHYLSAEIMGINLTKYRILSFGSSAFFAGIGGALYAHYLRYVSVEGFTILLSIQFLGMIIIGGLGSIMGTLLGTAFMVLLPEAMTGLADIVRGSSVDRMLSLQDNISYLREMAIGLVIVLFLIFEPDGLAHRWKQIKAYWKLYPFSH